MAVKHITHAQSTAYFICHHCKLQDCNTIQILSQYIWPDDKLLLIYQSLFCHAAQEQYQQWKKQRDRDDVQVVDMLTRRETYYKHFIQQLFKTQYQQESHAIAGRMVQCQCKFWYVTYRILQWYHMCSFPFSLSADCSESSGKEWWVQERSSHMAYLT